MISSGSRSTLKITFENGPIAEQSCLLNNGMTIGRSEGNSIMIADQTVSGSHAKIVFENGTFQIIDLNSTNGTLVNGEKVSKVIVKQNDKIQFGKVIATVQ